MPRRDDPRLGDGRAIDGGRPKPQQRGTGGPPAVADEDALKQWARKRGGALDFEPVYGESRKPARAEQRKPESRPPTRQRAVTADQRAVTPQQRAIAPSSAPAAPPRRRAPLRSGGAIAPQLQNAAVELGDAQLIADYVSVVQRLDPQMSGAERAARLARYLDEQLSARGIYPPQTPPGIENLPGRTLAQAKSATWSIASDRRSLRTASPALLAGNLLHEYEHLAERFRAVQALAAWERENGGERRDVLNVSLADAAREMIPNDEARARALATPLLDPREIQSGIAFYARIHSTNQARNDRAKEEVASMRRQKKRLQSAIALDKGAGGSEAALRRDEQRLVQLRAAWEHEMAIYRNSGVELGPSIVWDRFEQRLAE